jgi:hypothetical protein
MFGKSDTQWSARSQSDIREERRLREAVSRAEDRKRFVEMEIEGLREDEERRLKQLERDPAIFGPGWVSGVTRKLEDKRRDLAILEGCVTRAREKLDEHLTAEREGAEERRQLQSTMAALVKQRVKKDEEIEAELARLGKLRQERDGLTGKMQTAAEGLGMSCDVDGGFSELFSSLPTSVIDASRKWAKCFLGERDDVRAYVVYADVLEVQENLAYSGYYMRGDTVYLGDEEARELLRTDRRDKNGWLPPSVITVETFEKALEAAEGDRRYVWGRVQAAVERSGNTRQPDA